MGYTVFSVFFVRDDDWPTPKKRPPSASRSSPQVGKYTFSAEAVGDDAKVGPGMGSMVNTGPMVLD